MNQDEYYDYYTDDELSDGEIERLHKYEEIKHFTLDDYFRCDETKHLLIDEWNTRFNRFIEEKIKELYDVYRENIIQNDLNIMERSNEEHYIDLIELVKHHLVKDYDIGIFEENPLFAQPLKQMIQDEMKEESDNDYN